MRRALLLAACSLSLFAQDWSLERIMARPHLWGTPPERLTWSKQGHTLVFAWNAQGGAFRDLYAYHPDQQKLVRLTDLAGFKDDLLATEQEQDERLRQYLAPQPGVGPFALSHDGSKVALTLKGELFLVPTDGSQQPFRLTRTKAAEASPQWSPDGTKLAYTRQGQLYVQDLTTGQLTQPMEIANASLTAVQWSPDGKRFAYSISRGTGRQMPLPNYSGRVVKATPFGRSLPGDENPEYFLYLIDAAGRTKPAGVQQSAYGTKAEHGAPLWSEDGTKLVQTVRHPNLQQVQVRVIDAATGKTTVIREDKDNRWAYEPDLEWSPDSKSVLLSSDVNGWTHLFVVSADGKATKQLTSGNYETYVDRFMEPFHWRGDWVYYSSTERGPSERHFFRIHPDGTGKEQLSSQPGLNLGLVSQDGRHTAMRRADLNNPFDLYVDGKQVTRSPQPEFYKYQWPRTVFITFPSRGDGATVHAKMLLPPGYDPQYKGGKKWPSVFFVHGAGIATSVLKQWGSYQESRYAFNTYLAQQGYVIMDIDYRGSTGYGRDWRTDVYLHLGGKDLDDILGGVDYLAKLGNVDMKKIGIWGVSYGGFMTDMALFKAPGTFAAGSGWASVNDWENYNHGYTAERLSTPDKHPEAYRRSSPIYFSGNLQDHLLIVHGMVDSNVLFQDAVQLTEKLIQEGKSNLFEHIYYPEEDHGFVRDETWVDACRRTAEWFNRWLK